MSLRHYFHCYISIPRKCPHKTLFQHTVPPSPMSAVVLVLSVNNFDQFLTPLPSQLATSFMDGPLEYLRKCSTQLCANLIDFQ